jgi:hypothetical protein
VINTKNKLFSLYAFRLLPIAILILASKSIYKGIVNFYFFLLMPVFVTNGVVNKIDEKDAINGKFFRCQILYGVGDNLYTTNQILSYDEWGNIKMGDSIVVKYNLKNPSRATTDSSVNLAVYFIVFVLIILWSVYSVITIAIVVINKIRT